jgi:hypothetical protein
MNLKKINKISGLIIIFFFLMVIIIPHAFSRESITVLSDDNYPPYIFRDRTGRLQGIIVDQWELWSRKNRC